jgi:hypothetical protein
MHSAPRPLRALAAPAVLLLALAIAAPASAKPSASGTLSPAGGNRYVLTIKNTGSESFEVFGVAAKVTQLAPSPPCENRGTSFVCTGVIAPGASKQVCFKATLPGAYPTVQVTVGSGGVANEAIFEAGSAAPVSSCPIAGSSGEGSGGAGSRWTPAQCKVAYKAWRKHHARANARERSKESHTLARAHRCKLAPSILK